MEGYKIRLRYPPGEYGLIFTDTAGQPVRGGNFRARVWKPALARAGLPVALRSHDLRHSYATWLVSDGVPISDVAKVMAHEQTSTTLDRYTHSTRERDRRVLAAFAASGARRRRTAGPGSGRDGC